MYIRTAKPAVVGTGLAVVGVHRTGATVTLAFTEAHYRVVARYFLRWMFPVVFVYPVGYRPDEFVPTNYSVAYCFTLSCFKSYSADYHVFAYHTRKSFHLAVCSFR